jgi:peroxiredoxin
VLVAVSLSQLVLVVVFAVAGVAKLADLQRTRKAVVAFGVPPRLAPPAAVLLPLVELAIAAAMVPAASARWGALGAILILLAFSLAIVGILRRGAAVDCNCFGGLAQTEVGRGTLVRNALLGVLAVLVFVDVESVGAFGWVTAPAAGDRLAIALLVASVLGLCGFCWQLLRQNGRLLLRLDAMEAAGESSRGEGVKAPAELATGMTAPPFSGTDLDGEAVSLRSLLAPGRPVALFFTDPGCGACELVLDDVADAQRERAADLTLAVLSGGPLDRIERKAAEFGLDRVVPQDASLFDAYGVIGFPAIVLIDEQGRIARPAALGVDAVRDVVLEGAPSPELVGTGPG